MGSCQIYEVKNNCGIFCIYSPTKCLEYLQKGLYDLQHRGERNWGISILNGKKININTYEGLVFDFKEEDVKNAIFAMGHLSLKDPQPIWINSRIGEFTSAYEGSINNLVELCTGLRNRGGSFTTNYSIEVLAKLVAEGDDILDGIKKMAKQVKGSYCQVFLNEDGVYAVRDPFGFKPLVLGESKGSYAIASESCAFSHSKISLVRDVQPGEIIHINKNGFETIGRLDSSRHAHCAFEWAYIARIDSTIEGIPVKRARSRLGSKLASRYDCKVDIVSDVPMSGRGYALGYALKSGIPYDEVYRYNVHWGRSYLPLTQDERSRIADYKLSVIKEAVKDKKIVLCDDSIVRGTQIREKVKELKMVGAKEVHVRVASPKLVAPCKYGISTTSYEELIATHLTTEEIRRHIKADSLKYNTLEDFVEAIGLPKKELCLACFTGEYPI